MDRERIYVPLRDGRTIALNRETGETVWTSEVAGFWPPVLASSAVIAVTKDEAASLDRATGSIGWRIALPSNSIAPPVSTGELVLVALEDASILAIKAGDGAMAWSCRLDALVTPVSLAADAAAAYVTSGDSRVTAVTLSSGQLTWQVSLAGMLSPPALGKDRVFVGSTSNAFFALDAASGKKQWNWPPELVGGDVIGAAVDGNVAYFVGLDNQLRAVNRGNGNQRWTQSTPMRPIAPPAAFGGIVVVFGISPAIATFNAKTGAAISTFSIPSAPGVTAPPIPKGPPLIDSDMRPFRVAIVAFTADGRVVGMRPTGMMFRELPTVPLTDLPGRQLQRERAPARSQ